MSHWKSKLPRAYSKPEMKFLLAMQRDEELKNDFQSQYVIDCGIRTYIADFLIGLDLVVEVDDPKLHSSRIEKDELRDRLMKEKGLRVLRVTTKEVLKDVDKVLETIKKLRRRI